ncbi:DUF1003 domain-containing protein [Prosthecomicrobium sp. N25]|uniref:DUF1003 domain-containing protein n=1 Tax=Prosthecomicrobium sp. N25 TaxID=3129254 RepID=UPI003077F08C
MSDRTHDEAAPRFGADEEGLTPLLERNIEILAKRRRRQLAEAGFPDRLAEAVTRFTGSMIFVGAQALAICLWVAVNLGWLPVLPRFDETFVILATVASVEALFLSTFVLISQNRAAAEADRRADLDLQINLLAEHEVTRLITLVRAIADRLGVEEARDPALERLEDHVVPEKVLDELEARQAQDGENP